MLKRTIRTLALGGASLAGSMIACGSPSTANTGPITSATVSVDVYNGAGLKAGSCLGTMISPDTVLTAGHCAAGFSWWQVTSSTGQVAHSSIAYTYNWQNFESDLSHPNHDDVAALKLDAQINLAQYPTLATSELAGGSAAMRVRPAASGGVEAVGAIVDDGTRFGFPDYYATSFDASKETLVTGGAVIDPTSNTIYGVTSGRGFATGELYVSRVEMVQAWLSTMANCSGGGSSGPGAAVTTAAITTECHDQGPTPGCDAEAPPPTTTCDGGTTSSSSSSGGSSSGASSSGASSSGASSSGASSSGASSSGASSSGGSSSGGGSSSSGASSGGTDDGGMSSGGNGTTGGGSGAGSGDGGSCSGGGGYCQGSGCPGGGGNGTTGGGSSSGSSSGGGSSSSGASSSGSSSGASSSGSSSGGTTSGGNGTTGGSSSGASSSGASSSGASSGGGTTSGGNGTTSGSSSGASSSSGGYNGASNGGGTTSGGNGTTSSGSSGGNGTTGTGGDGPGCDDSSCGGCDPNDPTCTDNTIDFGGVPGSGTGTSGSRPY